MTELDETSREDDDAVSRVLARAASKSAGYTLFGSGSTMNGGAQALQPAHNTVLVVGLA